MTQYRWQDLDANRRNTALHRLCLVAAWVVLVGLVGGCDAAADLPPVDPTRASLQALIPMVSHFQSPGTVSVAVDGGYVYASGGDGWMIVDPGAGPDAAWVLRLEGKILDRMAPCEGHLLAFTTPAEVGVYGLRGGGKPKLGDSYENRGDAVDLACFGRRLVVARPESFDLWDVVSADELAFVGEVRFKGKAVGAMAAAPPYAYLAVDGLTVVDMSQSPPAVVATVATPAASALAFLDGRVHGASATSFFTVDVTNPTAPLLVAETGFADTGEPVALGVWKDLLVRSDPSGRAAFLAMDDPSAPVEVAALDQPFTEFAASASFLYFATAEGLAIWRD